MSTSNVRTAALLAVLAAGGLPLALNEWNRFLQRRGADARAMAFATTAEAARKTGDLDLAAAAFSEAVAASPDHTLHRERLLDTQVEQLLAGTAQLTPRSARRLTAELATALAGARNGDARYTLALGRVLQLREQAEPARALFQKVAERSPDNAQAQLFLGDAWLKAGKHDDAALALERATTLDPKNAEARFALGQTRLFQGKFEDAEKLLSEAALTLDRNPVLLRGLGKAQVRLKKFAAAVDSLERALTLDRNLDGVHALLGEAYANAGKIEAAIGALRVAWEKSQDVDAYRNLGRVLLQVGRHVEAVQVFKTLQALDPQDPEPLIALSMAAQAAGDLESATLALRRADDLVTKSGDPAVVSQWKKVVEQRRAGLAQALTTTPKAKPKPTRP
jgi:tetratricopeptide (TPR) repeat protein